MLGTDVLPGYDLFWAFPSHLAHMGPKWPQNGRRLKEPHTALAKRNPIILAEFKHFDDFRADRLGKYILTFYSPSNNKC